jgi:polyphosphate kinase
MELTTDNLLTYHRPGNFFNRDLSWLEFNRRVLKEAVDPDLPLLERIKFISIFFSNLDEFFMVRVAGIKEQIKAKITELSVDGLTPHQQLAQIEAALQPMIKRLYSCWGNEIIPKLAEHRIRICTIGELENSAKEELNRYFLKEVFPILTPLAFDPGRPFPYISNLSLSLAILIRKSNGEKAFARLKIPSTLPRLIRTDAILKPGKPDGNGEIRLIWIGDLIRVNLDRLFPGLEVAESYPFRITRDTDLEIQEDEADDLMLQIEENIKRRKFGNVVRLEVNTGMPDFMINTLIENLEITNSDFHRIDGPLGLSDIMILLRLLDFPGLKDKPYHTAVPREIEEEKDDLFSLIRSRDAFLFHPYDSFGPVIDFIKQAARDPDVLAIKQTLYRIGSDSPILKYLIEAAERNKQVAVLVELKARFDEENNIFWARELEKVGVHVVYGLLGLKTHCKMTLIVRKESDGLKRYVHLGTGNYNYITTKIYTDLGLFTSDENICTDVSEIFNFLTGYSENKYFREVFVSPINQRQKFLELIGREIKNVKGGGRGHLIFKMNALVDPVIITALYAASDNGVKIDLIIRGVCALIPQQPGLSGNIRVVSIVGRFLEHSRVYYFYNNGSEEIYLSSADLMSRNLDRRVEVTFPVKDGRIKNFIREKILESCLADNQKSRVLLPTGKYVLNHPVFSEKKINHQEQMMLLRVKKRKGKKPG